VIVSWRYSATLRWLQRHRWQLLAALLALTVLLRVGHVHGDVTVLLFLLVVLGIALFAPSLDPRLLP